MHYDLPRDPAQWLALVLCAAVWALAPLLASRPRRDLWFACAAALAASGLSAAYIAVYLRGGPRIIDATSYWLEARALSEGSFAWPLAEPAASTMGRFLVRAAGSDGPTAAVLFPPGYPAVLALGFLARAPLALGPLLAAGLVLVTVDLAAHVERTLAHRPPVPLARVAALLSVACAALRYHTADTMSHGLAALCFGGSLALAWRALDARDRPLRALACAALAGLAAGWLFATRPVSAAALGLSLGLLAWSERGAPPRPGMSRAWLAAAAIAGALPGLALFVAYQRAATGGLSVTAQALYYAASDGPPGCFRYGFGRGIGCLGEHGDFVAAQLPAGFGPLEAALTTLRRLKQHLVDAGNAEPLVLLVPAGAALAWKSPRARLLGAAVLLQIAVYVPFYFDGNYPGGGARFYADVLPLEHVLMAVAAAEIARRAGLSGARAALAVVPLALAGFAVRGGFDHAALRDREGGRPMYEPGITAPLAAGGALVFLDTDHGFNLAFDPAGGRLRFARYRGDALDAMAWEAAGRPAAYRYRFALAGRAPAEVALEPYAPALSDIVEGESLWPPIAQEGGYALVEHASGTCASAGRWLAVRRGDDGGPLAVTLALPAAARAVAPRVAGVAEHVDLALVADGERVHVWSIDPDGGETGAASPPRCVDLPPYAPPGATQTLALVLEAGPGRAGGVRVALDSLKLSARAGRPKSD